MRQLPHLPHCGYGPAVEQYVIRRMEKNNEIQCLSPILAIDGQMEIHSRKNEVEPVRHGFLGTSLLAGRGEEASRLHCVSRLIMKFCTVLYRI